MVQDIVVETSCAFVGLVHFIPFQNKISLMEIFVSRRMLIKPTFNHLLMGTNLCFSFSLCSCNLRSISIQYCSDEELCHLEDWDNCKEGRNTFGGRMDSLSYTKKGEAPKVDWEWVDLPRRHWEGCCANSYDGQWMSFLGSNLGSFL